MAIQDTLQSLFAAGVKFKLDVNPTSQQWRVCLGDDLNGYTQENPGVPDLTTADTILQGWLPKT